MLRLAVLFILLLLMLFGGAVWLLDMDPGPLAPKQQAKEQSPTKAAKSATAQDEAQELQEALSPPSDTQGAAPSFDIARIDPNGTSVFAGRAEPRSVVTITADGKEIGTAQADENGEWTFTTDAKIPNAEAKLALFKAPPGTKVADSAAHREEVKPEPPKRHTAGTVTSDMLKNLEGMVAAARTDEEKQTVAAAPPPAPITDDRTSPAGAPVAAAPPLPPTSQSAATSASVPVPVTFIFNEATLTSDGRRAAALLLEYLQLKRFPKVTLTGHADERGTHELNMNLSRERLETVASFLREGGFKGELELIPKGKTEPYTGVVRSDFSQEDLWQLDRRVELMVSR
ncbi:MAG: OmpA family protein [Hyphomicrobium sp.]|uniref:OmpA family protein n=1 Tax=Hyphomicrobium sp. TaxID=82 RepID=UPI0013213457|nr:OmpA family protein [Hyphomicrobium sp.]KAB2941603.1 MAG: OmpA family protein [Hyphomicrobium sp.]MBZ0210200.1 OmpA family protein [Hyphomicrobium sp.]